VPQTLGNPLFRWMALELNRGFEITEWLSRESAERVWAACHERLRGVDYRARGLIARANVECLCTSGRFCIR
jgi:glucuronate isomerase